MKHATSKTGDDIAKDIIDLLNTHTLRADFIVSVKIIFYQISV